MTRLLGPGPFDAITDVPGIRVGHWTDRAAATGCTVVLFDEAVTTAADVRGGAPGTRETDLLRAGMTVRQSHAIVLAGGSVFGLDAASGVVRYLSERGIGFPTRVRAVPIVPAAILFDLGIGDPMAAPGPAAGEQAARRAKGGRVPRGSVGAGTGATVAKALGVERAIKSGIGTASVTGPGGLIAGAIVAANAVGAIVDPATGGTIAGPRGTEPATMAGIEESVRDYASALEVEPAEATTIGVVAVNAALDHDDLLRLAAIGHDGYARTIFPAHTRADGDTVFAVASGERTVELTDHYPLAVMVTLAVERAMLDAVHSASGLGGVPSVTQYSR